MKTLNVSATIFCLGLLFFLMACGPSLEDQKAEISKIEAELKTEAGVMPDSVNGALAVGKYLEFVNANPGDTMSPIYLFKGAQVSAQTGNMHVSMQMLERLYTEYPKHADAPQALFLKGFLAETQMADYKTSEKCYREFLKLYPQHPLANDVSISLKNLGKPPEQWLREMPAPDSVKTK